MKTLALRKVSLVLAGGLALFAIQEVAVAAEEVTGIRATRHNLSISSSYNKFTPGVNSSGSSADSEICAFCHTPHGAALKDSKGNAVSAPLWNRSLGAKEGEYTTYAALGTTTLDGAVAPVGSVSLACLSCHDGTQAMNTMINQPGSGGYYSGDGTPPKLEGTWSGPTANKGTEPGRFNFKENIAWIGTDLRNDHPVGIQYGGGGYLQSDNLNKKNEPATGTSIDSDFVRPTVKSDANKAVFWVETGAASSGRQKTDLVLYTRNTPDTGVDGGPQPFVECASCHDPHVSGTKTFLRISNTSSGLCLACHTK